MKYETKLHFRKALEKLEGTYNRKELYRILTLSEKFGLEWGTRTMYGGGTSISINDKYDLVAEVSIYNEEIHLSFYDDYFDKDFKYSEIRYYSDEQLAEIKMEESLYGYEMPHYYIVKGKDL